MKLKYAHSLSEVKKKGKGNIKHKKYFLLYSRTYKNQREEVYYLNCNMRTDKLKCYHERIFVIVVAEVCHRRTYKTYIKEERLSFFEERKDT